MIRKTLLSIVLIDLTMVLVVGGLLVVINKAWAMPDALNAQILQKEQKEQKTQTDAAPQVMEFISLSMPPELIKKIVEEAQDYQVPVVLRGLKNNSFQETAQALFELLKDAPEKKGAQGVGLDEKPKRSGVLIDPLWFRQFHIQTVPALVVAKRPLTCAPQKICPSEPFDVIYGNLPMKQALEIIAEKGTGAPDVARTLLKRANA